MDQKGALRLRSGKTTSEPEATAESLEPYSPTPPSARFFLPSPSGGATHLSRCTAQRTKTCVYSTDTYHAAVGMGVPSMLIDGTTDKDGQAAPRSMEA